MNIHSPLRMTLGLAFGLAMGLPVREATIQTMNKITGHQ